MPDREARQAIARLARDGRDEEARARALELLRATTLGDDRAEQDLVRLLDALRLDDAIIQGWDVLVARRQEIHADGDLQYTHAIESWREALERIADEHGPLAAAASVRARAPVLPEDAL